jgi:hypothetical protein
MDYEKIIAQLKLLGEAIKKEQERRKAK